MHNIYPQCLLCGETPRNGLYDGFRLNGKFICSCCEERFVTAEMDSLEYQRNIRDIRCILYG